MYNTNYRYTVPLSPTPIPIQAVTLQHNTQAQDVEEKRQKTKEDLEQEKLEWDRVLESLKPLEEDHFFFIEVTVDSIEMVKEESQETEELAPLNVSIKFEMLPNMTITQEDFIELHGMQEMVSGKVVYEEESKSSIETEDKVSQWRTKCGVSSLFNMSPMSLVKSFQRNHMEVVLYRTNSKEVDFSTIIGQTEFLLDEDFCRCVLQASDIKFAANLPKSLIKQDVYSIKNNRNEETAKISLILRLSCFGSVIVTRCERRESSNTYIFKNSPLMDTFQCQNYQFQVNSPMAKSNATKCSIENCNCMKKSADFICPGPSRQELCFCMNPCWKQKENNYQKLCPFQKNCPFLKPGSPRLMEEKV